jgi:hypothetical protein
MAFVTLNWRKAQTSGRAEKIGCIVWTSRLRQIA